MVWSYHCHPSPEQWSPQCAGARQSDEGMSSGRLQTHSEVTKPQLREDQRRSVSLKCNPVRPTDTLPHCSPGHRTRRRSAPRSKYRTCTARTVSRSPIHRTGTRYYCTPGRTHRCWTSRSMEYQIGLRSSRDTVMCYNCSLYHQTGTHMCHTPATNHNTLVQLL